VLSTPPAFVLSQDQTLHDEKLEQLQQTPGNLLPCVRNLLLTSLVTRREVVLSVEGRPKAHQPELSKSGAPIRRS
jgi:hypothetical protein